MAEKENELLKYEGSIFKKIINWFKKLFHRNDTLPVQKNKEKPNTEVNNQEKTETISKEEKDKFFKLYEDVKAGKVDVNSLSFEELERFNTIISEEINLKKNKLENLKKENAKIEIDIKKKEEEKDRLKAQINA